MDSISGARVRSFTPYEAREILVARERLEGVAAALAAESISAEQLKEPDHAFENMTRTAKTDLQAYAEHNRKFHAVVVQATGNRIIAKFIEQTRYQLVVRQFWNVDITHPRRESLGEHRGILVTLKARDGSAAERMMRLHVSGAPDALKLGVAAEKRAMAG